MKYSPPDRNPEKRHAPEIRARPFDKISDRPSGIENLLSSKEQEELRAIATVLDYRRGGITIFSEGEDAHFVYAIDEGVVRVSRHAENGQRQILAFMVPGDLFGLPHDGIYVNTVEAVCPARIYRFPWQRLREIMVREPQLQLNMLIRVAYDLRQAQRQIMILGQKNTYQRLAVFLLEFLRYPEFYDSKKSRLNLPINRFDLADYLGIARETAARAFARLEREGLARRLASGSIEILDVNGLRQLQRAGKRRNSPLIGS
ncbi:MAG TPA: helix-turn-helix domain-containing protein [Micropepsaceae bacterium]|nr:helix-turn-helix domain-containing protein [Micropepsaceae bacterium]